MFTSVKKKKTKTLFTCVYVYQVCTVDKCGLSQAREAQKGTAGMLWGG